MKICLYGIFSQIAPHTFAKVCTGTNETYLKRRICTRDKESNAAYIVHH